VAYNKEGKELSTTRYYTEDQLPLKILYSISKEYAGKKVKSVTEIIVEGQVLYSVNVEDDKRFYVVESDTEGHLHLNKKFFKQ
jgi:hypothetical protein